jgi:hypothetical protein
MVPPWRGPPFASEFAGGAVTSAGTGWLRVGKMVAAATRLLLGRNTHRRFNRHSSKVLRAPLFSHTPP